MAAASAPVKPLSSVSSRRCIRPARPATRLVVKARMGGGGLMDRPTVKYREYDSNRDISLGVLEPPTDTGNNDGNTDKQKGTPPGGGDYRVLLIDSPKHTERQVVQAITKIVPGSDQNHARNCFTTSKELGMAIVTTCLKEHAEHYAQQLYRFGCKTAIEPDSAIV